MKLIDKDKIVAEIRKRLLPVIRDKHYGEWEEGQDSERIAILGIIDNIETKEVDLDEEVTNQIRLLNGVHTLYDSKQWWKGTYNELSYFAKYFYDLGLNTQKGE